MMVLLTPFMCVAQEVQDQIVALKDEVMAVFEAMPRDLQHTVLSSPGRASMIHRLSQRNKV